jgi:S-methylmethionine-dependent homocysteine/selenocysteine methylase
MPKAFRDRLRHGAPLLLDAAMGTELARRGSDTAPPLWSARALIESPDLVRTIHEENVAAGAEVLTADTFRTHGRNLKQGLDPLCLEGKKRPTAAELSALAVRLAREAATAHSVRVAGSLAPLEDCYRPDLVPSDGELSVEHRAQAEALAAAGVDLILVETMNSVRELVAATTAALETGLPVIASMVTDGEGRLLSGESIAEAARALLSLRRKPAALGINCVPARTLGADLGRLAAAAPGVPLAAYGNAGRALDEPRGLFTDPIDPAAYADLARGWIVTGARLVGSCCGTTADHIAALRVLVRGSSPGSSGPSASRSSGAPPSCGTRSRPSSSSSGS